MGLASNAGVFGIDDVPLGLLDRECLPRRVGRLVRPAGEPQHLAECEQRVALHVDEIRPRGWREDVSAR